jgi:SAM-dependent methyltransferase
MNMFTKLELTRDSIDVYYVRKSILDFINENMQAMSGSLLDIGCGKMPYRDHIKNGSNLSSYEGLDIESALVYDEKVKPDFTWDGRNMPFEANRYDWAMATEVLEHCQHPDMLLSEAYRVLKPGGTLVGTIPFLWPLHEVPHDAFRYTPFTLSRLLEDCGFEKNDIRALGGWHASMAQMMGLWLKRAPLSERFRRRASFLVLPVYKKLLQIDQPPPYFKESTMITGLSFVARKPK